MRGNLESLGNRQAWIANRQTYIGGSDAAAIVGACPYRAAIEVYADKLGQLPPKETSEAMKWGQILEPVIAQEVSDRIGREVQVWDQATIVRHPERNWQACTPDALLDDGEQLLQIKTTGNRDAEHEVPLSYQVQVQHELAVTGCSRAYLAILIGGQKLVIHEVEPNERFQEFLTARELFFWECVRDRKPPAVDASDSARRAINAMFNAATQPALLSSEAAIEAMEKDQQLAQIKGHLQDLEARKKLLENQLLGLMAGNEVIELPNGIKLSYKQQTRKGYVVEDSSFRVFRRSVPK